MEILKMLLNLFSGLFSRGDRSIRLRPSQNPAKTQANPVSSDSVSNETELFDLYYKLGWGIKGLSLLKRIQITRNLGFDDYCITSQAYYESGAFKKVIGNWNMWGIKKPKIWTGKVWDIHTHETINGISRPVVDSFIDFNSIDEAVNWWCDLIKRLYKPAYARRGNASLFIPELCNIKNLNQYATDSKYVIELYGIYKHLKSNKTLNEILSKII